MSLLDEKEIETLERLEELLTCWNIKRYALIGAYALRALGYDVEKGKHLNVIVDFASLPWKVREARREILPPYESRYFQDYIQFIEKGTSIHLIPYSPDLFERLLVLEYKLRMEEE
jgi:hypothetical protein